MTNVHSKTYRFVGWVLVLFSIGILTLQFLFNEKTISTDDDFFISAQYPPHQHPSCGPKSLFLALRKSGIDVTFEDLEFLFPNLRSCVNSFSMRDLKCGAESVGAVAIAVNLSSGDLMRIDMPAILHLPGKKHFIFYSGHTRDNVFLIDYPNEPIIISKETLEKEWKGDTLLVSDKPDNFPKALRNMIDE